MCLSCVELLIVPHTPVTQQVWVVLVGEIAQSSARAVLRYCVSHKQSCSEAVYQELLHSNRINNPSQCCVE